MAKKAEKVSANAAREAALAEMEEALVGAGIKGAAKPITKQEIEPIVRIPTPSIYLNWATNGGVPRGRISEFYGVEGCGKSTLALAVIAEMQRQGEIAALVDMEHAFDRDWAMALGINIDEMRYAAPDTAEDAFKAIEIMIKSGVVSTIVLDSVAALVPRAELEGDIGDAHMAVQARMMSQAMRILAGAVSRNNVALIFINQLRDSMGKTGGYGPTTTTTGGKALRFWASLRLDMGRFGPIKGSDEDDEIGSEVKIKVAKNRGGRSMRKVKIPFVYGEGFSPAQEAIDVGLLFDVVEKSGNTYLFAGEKLAVGRLAAVRKLRETPELLKAVQTALQEALQKVE